MEQKLAAYSPENTVTTLFSALVTVSHLIYGKNLKAACGFLCVPKSGSEWILNQSNGFYLLASYNYHQKGSEMIG